MKIPENIANELERFPPKEVTFTNTKHGKTYTIVLKDGVYEYVGHMASPFSLKDAFRSDDYNIGYVQALIESYWNNEMRQIINEKETI